MLKYFLWSLLGLTVLFTSTSSSADEPFTEYVEKICKQDCPDPDILKMAIYESSSQLGIDPNVMLAIFVKESSLRPNATNKTNGKSKGLGQIQVAWHLDKFRSRNHYDIFDNVYVSTTIYRDCLRRYKGNQNKALWCYNGHQSFTYSKKANKIYSTIKDRKYFTQAI